MIEFFRKLKWLVHRRRREEELREELQFHIDEEADQQGLREVEARRELGNLTRLREDTRSAWGWTAIEQLLQDLRYAFRTMSANKLFTLLAILSLALGIGANTAIYSFLDSILLRSLPVSDPPSLVVLNWRSKQFKWGGHVLHGISGSTYDSGDGYNTSGIFPYPAFELFEKQTSVFSSVFAYRPAHDLNASVKGQAYHVQGEYVSGEYFQGLGLAPTAGRLIIGDDDRFGASPVAVVSFEFSQARFGGPANAPGQPLLINNQPFLVVGVTPPGFFGVDPGAAPEVFLPFHLDGYVDGSSQFGPNAQEYLDKNYYWVEAMARLRPGVSLAQAQATVEPNFANWVVTTASNDAERANLPVMLLKPGATGLETLRREYSKPLYVLLALVGLILAIACANVANLLLARATARRREIALRLSVGAGRFRVVRQLLTESVLLASLGGAAGLLFAIWGMRVLTLLLANGDEAFTLHAELNVHVLSVAIALSLLSGVLFGLAPALQATRVDVISAIKEVRAGERSARRVWGRFSLSHALIVGQIALSLLMLTAAGLFVRTLSNLHSIELGFNRENVLLFNLNARRAGRPPSETAGFFDDLRKQFAAIPGIRDVSLSNQMMGHAGFGLGDVIPGKKPNPDDRMLMIGPGFFRTLQIPIVAGREIEDRDKPGSPPVAVISEYFAKVNFGNESPLGKHVMLPGRPSHPVARDMEIVGVVKDTKYGGIRDKMRPVLYIAYDQGWPTPEGMYFELRTKGDPLSYANIVRDIVHRADARVPVTNVITQAAEINRAINQEIVLAELCTAFALLALVIACVGLYGTISYNVARRTGEIGIRMALGARRGKVIEMILRQVFVLTALGLAIGVPVAFGTSKLVASFLYGMKPNDPLALTAAAAILLAAAIIAGYAPARRASRIDPMVALRHE
jgi:macrolide transport system ATP-binding/permease protein